MKRPEDFREFTKPQPVFPFIIGCGRSGTTLLQAMFDSHPQMAVAFKSYFVQDLGALRERYETADGFVAEEAAQYLKTHYCFTRWNIDEGLVRQGFDCVKPANLSEMLRMAFALYAFAQGKTRYGDKSNRYANGANIALLAKLFPESRFVQLIRDGRNVALSYLEVEWGPSSFVEAAHQWKQRVQDARNAGRALGDRRYREVRYEHLVENPEEILRSLCDYFEIEFHPAMFRYPERADSIARPLKYFHRHASLQLPVTKGLRDWRSQATRHDVEEFEAIAGDLLAELGYDTLT
jgi:hypothetical protein